MTVLSYTFLALMPSYFLVSFAWSILISDRLYHCSDRIFFLTDFIPPFVHNVMSDCYLRGMGSTRLMAIWCAFVFLMFLMSGIVFRIINKKGAIAKIIFICIVTFLAIIACIFSFFSHMSWLEKSPEAAKMPFGIPSEWRLYENEEGNFSIWYPPDWNTKTVNETDTIKTFMIESPQGEIDLSWGSGFGGACPQAYEKIQIQGETLPTCHYLRKDGSEAWEQISRESTDGRTESFSGRAYAKAPYQKNRDTVLKILTTLLFSDSSSTQ